MTKVSKIIKSTGLLHSTANAFGNIFGSGISAIAMILISRMLPPSDFGDFSVAFSLSQMVARIGDLGLINAMKQVVAKNYQTHPTKASQAINQVFHYKLIVTAITLALSFTISNYLSSRIFHLHNEKLVLIGLITGIVLYAYEFVVAIFQATNQFFFAGILNMVQAVVKLAFMIFYFLKSLIDPTIIYLTYALAPIVAVLAGIAKFPRYDKSIPDINITKFIQNVAKYSAIGMLAAAVSDQADVLIVNSMLDSTQTGLYSAANRIVLMASLFGLSFGTVLNTRAAQYHDRTHLAEFFNKSFLLLTGSLLLIPFAFLLAKPVLIITAGHEYLPATSSLIIMLLGAILTLMTMPFMAAFYTLNAPNYYAISGLIQSISMVVLDFTLVPMLSIEGAAIAKTISRLFLFLFSFYYALKIAKKERNVTFNWSNWKLE